MLISLRYALRRARRGLRSAAGVSLLTTATLAASLLLLGLYAMGVHNLTALVERWGRPHALTCVLEVGLPAARWETARAGLAGLPGVRTAQVLPPAVALAQFRDQGEAAAALVRGVEPDFIPAQVMLELAPTATAHAVALAARSLYGVAEVDDPGAAAAGLRRALRLLRLGGLALGAGVTLLTGFVVASTIRLAIYGRRDEIAILRLVGATRRFVAAPFVLEGTLWGAGAGGLALLALLTLDRLAAPRLSAALSGLTDGLTLRFFVWPLALGLLPLGLALGSLGSLAAVLRFLRLERG